MCAGPMEGSSAKTDAPHIEELLGHTAWARRLAAGIVTEAASAEDAVQNAWVAALLHPRDTRGTCARGSRSSCGMPCVRNHAASRAAAGASVR